MNTWFMGTPPTCHNHNEVFTTHLGNMHTTEPGHREFRQRSPLSECHLMCQGCGVACTQTAGRQCAGSLQETVWMFLTRTDVHWCHPMAQLLHIYQVDWKPFIPNLTLTTDSRVAHVCQALEWMRGFLVSGREGTSEASTNSSSRRSG